MAILQPPHYLMHKSRTVSLIILIQAVCLLFGGCATGVRKRCDVHNLEDRLGVKVDGIRWSAAGYILDFRYIVTDPVKAAPLFKPKTYSYLIDQKTGAKHMVPSPPKVGPLRAANKPIKDRGYFILFANPGRRVKPRDLVTVVIGDVRFETLMVQE